MLDPRAGLGKSLDSRGSSGKDWAEKKNQQAFEKSQVGSLAALWLVWGQADKKARREEEERRKMISDSR